MTRSPSGLSCPATAMDTVDFHRNEALTTLYVALHRELRGEHPAAMRFIKVYAVDRVLALVRLDPGTKLDHPDPFEATRRIERACVPAGFPLRCTVPGYTDNLDAARAVFWHGSPLTHDTDPAIVAAIRELTTTLDNENKTDNAEMPPTAGSERPSSVRPEARAAEHRR